jgi:hypothetical protein
MADLITALRNADAAGDVEAAKRIAAMIKAQRQQSQQDVALPSINPDVPAGGDAPAFSARQAIAQQETPSLGERALGVGENILSLGSGIIAEPVAGIAGLVQSVNPFADEGAGARAVEATREALTFDPRTRAGKSQQQALGEALTPVGEAMTGAERFLGENVLDLTGSPALASVAHSLPTAALEVIGLKGSKKLTDIKAPSDKLIKKTLVESAPEINQIKNASRAIFNELDQSGVSIKQSALKRLESNLDEIVKKQGIRERVTPEAFGAVQEIKKDIALGNPIPTSQMDELRTVAKNAIVKTDDNKIRVGSAIVDEIDSFLDDIKAIDIEKGAQVSAKDVGKKYRAARKLWGRAKRAEMLQEAIDTGASRKAGVEKGIRNELNNLLNRKKSRKFLSDADVKAIRKVTDGDFKQNFPSLVGGMGLKLENSPSLFASIVGGGGVGALASQVPGAAGIAVPAAIGAVTVGTVAKEVAKKITKNRANFLKTMAGAGNDAERITKAYLRAVPKNKRSISDLSDLLLDPNIDLTALDNISNEMVQDAIKATRFKRELTQAAVAGGIGSGLQESRVANEESN